MPYKARQMTERRREEVLRERKRLKRPWHSPPHFGIDRTVYMLTGTCYQHQSLLATPARRDEWREALLAAFEEADADVRAWVVLPNHWHVLASVALPDLRPLVGRLNNGKSTQWNREDGAPGRKVWHRFADRRIRNERHYFASVNYIHANPVRHKCAKDSRQWPWSSLHTYLEEVGRDTLKQWWHEYPVDHYGKGWDDL